MKRPSKCLRRIKRKDYPPLYQLLGNAYDMAGDRKRAVKTYEKGLRENPDAGRLYLELGNIAYAERQYDRALACYRRGATVDPAHPSNYRSLALLYAISTEPVWTLVWGELFMNLERGSGRTSAMSRNARADLPRQHPHRRRHGRTHDFQPQRPRRTGGTAPADSVRDGRLRKSPHGRH